MAAWITAPVAALTQSDYPGKPIRLVLASAAGGAPDLAQGMGWYGVHGLWSAIAALDCSSRRWVAFTRFVDGGQLPVVNNWIKNQIRPIALGRAATGCLQEASVPANVQTR